MLNRIVKCLCVLFCFALISVPAFAGQPTKSWKAWVSDLRKEAILEGIRPQLFDYVFRNMQPNPRLIRLDRNQPEKRLTFYKYRSTRCDAYRIAIGKKEFHRYHSVLKEIGQSYGVSPFVITALWGMESSYGRYPGGFSTVRALATLAYDGRRSAFFRRELLHALHMLNEGHVKLKDLKGEWAGATGQPQFLPSSWHRYAVDYNLDGKKDIWTTEVDVFASIANYLKQHGWEANQPWGFEVVVPQHFNKQLLGLNQHMPLHHWLAQGIRIKGRHPLPNRYLQASLIHPYGGPYFLVFNNFKVLMKWNHSTFYAATVGYLADALQYS
ncbi:MAG: lytic murein transglycosylase [Pseudomonadota bacterium]|nr:lytic murein transglycosylase [Gammaproteobacteria bacterium]MBU1628905.1 lytic murein transglycosylase [Gammaproteobacteria bacterium]MBU1926970.1 lytic murein transglycosylase [Gammaproteobacteria bacterium]MBU2546598.1 lytic murein transglycosylase [Gammaproteobacteria bacterium]